jgi:uncharacterized protein
MMHPFIGNKLEELNGMFKRHNVKKAYLFGSACTDAFNESSDVDFLIEPGDEADPLVKGENLWNLYYALKGFLNRDIDMITRDNLTNKYFVQELDRTSVAIYG